MDRKWWWIGGAILAALAMATTRALSNVLASQTIRVDASGDGHFGAGRGDHIHKGVDLLAMEGEPVRSPISGTVRRITDAYTDTMFFRNIVLAGEGYEVKLMYVAPIRGLHPGQVVQRGQVVGTAQAVSQRYGPPMQDHVHIELRTQDGATLINPEPLLSLV